MARCDPDRPLRLAYVIGTFSAHPLLLGTMNEFLNWSTSPEAAVEYEDATQRTLVRARQIVLQLLTLRSILPAFLLFLLVVSTVNVFGRMLLLLLLLLLQSSLLLQPTVAVDSIVVAVASFVFCFDCFLLLHFASTFCFTCHASVADLVVVMVGLYVVPLVDFQFKLTLRHQYDSLNGGCIFPRTIILP
jgi:hypothetical protein